MLQQHRPWIGRSELDARSTRSGTGGLGGHTTFAAMRLDGSGLPSEPIQRTIVKRPIQFKSDDEFFSFRARGRERASAQRNW
jgi:hypothetical protein